MNIKFVITGVLLIVIGIVLGAFGAHGLKVKLVNFPEKLESFETGLKYQMYSGFTFLIIGLNASKFTFSLKNIFVFWFLGVLLFSGSIYFLSIQPILKVSLSFLGPVTPIGGGFIIIGWVVFLIRLLKNNNQ
jgi:uncharacterized membrane protein YgdD (TMEM256/DUF423 family)